MSPEPLGHWATRQFTGNSTCMYFLPVNISARKGLEPASSTWWDFGEVPHFKASVRRLKPPATGVTVTLTTNEF